MPSMPDIKLTKTYTTHDLSQKAEKRKLKQRIFFLHASDTTKNNSSDHKIFKISDWIGSQVSLPKQLIQDQGK